MAMKETERSLRWYLLIAGGLTVIGALMTMNELPTRLLPSDLAAVLWYATISRLVFGAAYVVAGVSLTKALLTGARWIQYLVLFSGASLVIELLWGLAVSQGGPAGSVGVAGGFVGLAIRIAIVSYLYVNIRRLSIEAQTRAAATTFE
jgi:hypothetical protein